MKELNKQIEALHLELLRREKIIIHLENVKKKLADREKELIDLERLLEKEQFALEQLEQLSLWGLFSKILGKDIREQKEERRQQYLMAFLQYNDCKKRIESKLFEIRVMEEQLASLSKVEGQLQQLITKKRMQLKFKNKTLADRIIKQEELLRTKKAKLKEIKEAIVYGKKPLRLLEKIHEVLKEMKRWNIFSNRGLNPRPVSFYNQKKFVKRKMNDIIRLNKELDEFSDELYDVCISYKLDHTDFIRHLKTFMERFYKGLISDWVFYKEVKTTTDIVLEMIQAIKLILESLEVESEKTKELVRSERDTLNSMVIFLDS